MKTNLFKTMSIVASLCFLTACPEKKSENQLTAPVGPQGRITALGTANTYCDISNGTILCSSIDNLTGRTCNSSTKTYNQQDISSFCQQMSQLQIESSQGGTNSCDVSAAVNRIINEHCRGIVTQPNPNQPFPNNPNQPLPNLRFINCKVKIDDAPDVLISLAAGSAPSSYKQYLFQSKKVLKGLLTVPSRVGEVFFGYIPAKGRIPETLTIVSNTRDKETGRRIYLKHSGFAGQLVRIEAQINGASLTASCNDSGRNNQNLGGASLSDNKSLVCTASSAVTGTKPELDIQFVRPLNSIVSGEEMEVSKALRVTLNKANSMLTVRTVVDYELGPDMTSSSSLRADALVEANEGIGKAKMTCSIK